MRERESIRASRGASPKDFGTRRYVFVPICAPQKHFPSGAAHYGVRRPEPVPGPHGTLRARWTQREARRAPTCWRPHPERLVRAVYFSSRHPSRASHPSAAARFADRLDGKSLPSRKLSCQLAPSPSFAPSLLRQHVPECAGKSTPPLCTEGVRCLVW
jgi:hypothetical protein